MGPCMHACVDATCLSGHAQKVHAPARHTISAHPTRASSVPTHACTGSMHACRSAPLKRSLTHVEDAVGPVSAARAAVVARHGAARRGPQGGREAAVVAAKAVAACLQAEEAVSRGGGKRVALVDAADVAEQRRDLACDIVFEAPDIAVGCMRARMGGQIRQVTTHPHTQAQRGGGCASGRAGVCSTCRARGQRPMHVHMLPRCRVHACKRRGRRMRAKHAPPVHTLHGAPAPHELERCRRGAAGRKEGGHMVQEG